MTQYRSMPTMDHMTGACAHDTPQWCAHCLEGCINCGDLDCDDEYCPECFMEIAIQRADSLHDQMNDEING